MLHAGATVAAFCKVTSGSQGSNVTIWICDDWIVDLASRRVSLYVCYPGFVGRYVVAT